MPPQDQAPVKDAYLEPVPMNLRKETAILSTMVKVNFSGCVSLAEKKSADMAGMDGRGVSDRGEKRSCFRQALAPIAGCGSTRQYNRWKSLSVDVEEVAVGRGRWRRGCGHRQNSGEKEEDQPLPKDGDEWP
ncbi:hypothetical protein GW17_00045799 [Ensete ventricosum]|nr:hypothetical protein GW17_00045799 [Ensete ventricosum]